MTDAEKFLDVIGRNYQSYRSKLKEMQRRLDKPYSDDVVNDTIVKCYDVISRNGVRDNSEQGLLNYFFQAFKMNTLADIKSAYNQRNTDISDSDFSNAIETYYATESNAVKRARNDYCAHRIIEIASQYGDELSFFCFRLKYVANITYKDLIRITGVKDAKKRVLAVREYVKNATNKKTLIKEFEDFFDYE